MMVEWWSGRVRSVCVSRVGSQSKGVGGAYGARIGAVSRWGICRDVMRGALYDVTPECWCVARGAWRVAHGGVWSV